MADIDPRDQFHAGDRLGAHTLLCPVAAGGMGTVWCGALAGARGFSKLVAIKTILHELADEVQYARALRDEAQLAASLSHPHLCEVIELGEAKGYPYLVMEWVDGASLGELLGGAGALAGQRLEPRVAAQIAADACAGLHALHEARDAAGQPLGAVHRDVSPHNLLLTRLGQVKVTDLGVAKARGQWRARTRSGELRGKLGYLAPEQLRGARVDRRADVFAVGCVLYLALAGALPYPAEVGSFELVLTGRYEPLARRAPELPAELCAIVERCLAPDPDARFPSALALREALERWRAGLGVEHGSKRIAACLEERLAPLIATRNASIQAAFEQVVARGEAAAEPAPRA